MSDNNDDLIIEDNSEENEEVFMIIQNNIDIYDIIQQESAESSKIVKERKEKVKEMFDSGEHETNKFKKSNSKEYQS